MLRLYRTLVTAPIERLPVIREACVRESAREASEIARRYISAKYRVYKSWDEQNLVPLADRLAGEWSSFSHGRLIVGDPAMAVEQLRQYRDEVGATDLIFRVQWPGLPNSEAIKTMRVLTEMVFPALEEDSRGDGHNTPVI